MGYAEALWNQSLRCQLVYDEQVLKVIFLEGLPGSIHHSMTSYWGSQQSDTVHDLLRNPTSLRKLQWGLHSTGTTPITKSRIFTGEIMDAKAVTLILSELVGPRLYCRCCVWRLEHQLPRRLCRYAINSIRTHHSCILHYCQREQAKHPFHTSSGGKSSDDSMSRDTAANTGLDIQGMEREASDSPETPLTDPPERAPWTLSTVRR